MFFIALGALVPLIFRCETTIERIAIAVYGVCSLSMFAISSLYHRITWVPEKRLFWKKLDHAGIYLMIAGSFTPIALLGLPRESGMTLLKVIWAVAALGVLQSLFFVNMPKIISALFYMVMGYLILPYIGELKESLGMQNIWLIIAGGAAYSIGALCYGLKRPILNPNIFGYHEVFHLMVNVGAILHFTVINSFIH